jgi:hypothetical protein
VTLTNSSDGYAGRDSSVGIANRHGTNRPGFESRWAAIFPALVQTDQWAYPVFRTTGTVSFPRVKWPGRVVDNPPPPSAQKIKKQSYTCPSLWSFMTCSRVSFTFSSDRITLIRESRINLTPSHYLLLLLLLLQ